MILFLKGKSTASTIKGKFDSNISSKEELRARTPYAFGGSFKSRKIV